MNIYCINSHCIVISFQGGEQGRAGEKKRVAAAAADSLSLCVIANAWTCHVQDECRRVQKNVPGTSVFQKQLTLDVTTCFYCREVNKLGQAKSSVRLRI